MKSKSVENMNEKVRDVFLLIKNVKEIYNILDKLNKKRKRLETIYQSGGISKEDYIMRLKRINNKILKLESRIYIYLGKIRQSIIILREYLSKDQKFYEEPKKIISESLKTLMSPIFEYVPQNQKISSEILKIEEELKKIEKIPEISKIEKFEPKKEEKVEKYKIKEISLVKKRIKKEEKELNIFKIFIEISGILFGRLSNYFLDKHPDIHYRLRKLLFKGKINISPSNFLSFMIFISFIISIVIILLFLFVFEVSVLIFLPIIIIAIPLISYAYVEYRTTQIRRNIDINLPFASVHILSLLQTGIDVENCFRLISEIKDYGFLSFEFKRLSDLLNAGISLSDAIEHIRDTTVSNRFKEFLDELLLTLRSGRNIKEFFLIYTESQLVIYRTDLEKLNQVMKNFSDLYVGIVLTIPMLVISVGIMLSTISASIFGLSVPEFLNLLSLVILPMINIGFIIFISKLEI